MGRASRFDDLPHKKEGIHRESTFSVAFRFLISGRDSGQNAIGQGCGEAAAETPGPGRLLGRTTTLETLECALQILQVGGSFLEFGAIDFGALVETGVLDCRRGWNCK